MREKTLDIPDIRDVFEKKGSDHKSTVPIVHTVLSGKKQVRFTPQFTGCKPKNCYNLPNLFTITIISL